MIISRDLFILGDEYFSVTSKSRYEMKKILKLIPIKKINK
jgi:hypothetical protein